MNPIKRACEILGSQRALADALKVTPGAINQWMTGHKPFPVARCIDVEAATKGAVRCEELRPDVSWNVLRGTAAVNAENAPNSATQERA